MGRRRNLTTVVAAGLAAVTAYDLRQKRHSILRNFPLLGHARYILEEVGPELRQYIVTSNTEERPFNRDQRRWIYASSKQENNYFAFGTSKDLETSPNYFIIKHSPFPLPAPVPGDDDYDDQYRISAAKVMGAARGRANAFRPESVINVSAMSYGALSSNAIAALNQGAKIAGCLHNSGEGGISPYHRQGGEPHEATDAPAADECKQTDAARPRQVCSASWPSRIPAAESRTDPVEMPMVHWDHSWVDAIHCRASVSSTRRRTPRPPGTTRTSAAVTSR